METYSTSMAVSLLIQYCSKSLIEDCGGSFHIPVDRGGGVKIKAFTSLILYTEISSLAHARYKYQCSHQAKGHNIS